MKLTAKQEALFNCIESSLRKETALEYIKLGYSSGIQAYKKACKNLKKKPSKNPDVSSAEILNYPSVVAFIDSVRIVVAEEVQIDAAWVLEQAKNSFLINAKTFKTEANTDEMVNAGAAGKFLEMCGKHVNVKAFDKETQVINNNNIMPVPTADSIDSWEQQAQSHQDKLLSDV